MTELEKQLKAIGQSPVELPSGLSDKVYSKMLASRNETHSEPAIALILGGVFLMNFLITTLIALVCIYFEVFSGAISSLIWIGMAVVYGSVNVTLYGGIYIYRDRITTLLKMN